MECCLSIDSKRAGRFSASFLHATTIAILPSVSIVSAAEYCLGIYSLILKYIIRATYGSSSKNKIASIGLNCES